MHKVAFHLVWVWVYKNSGKTSFSHLGTFFWVIPEIFFAQRNFNKTDKILALGKNIIAHRFLPRLSEFSVGLCGFPQFSRSLLQCRPPPALPWVAWPRLSCTAPERCFRLWPPDDRPPGAAPPPACRRSRPSACRNWAAPWSTAAASRVRLWRRPGGIPPPPSLPPPNHFPPRKTLGATQPPNKLSSTPVPTNLSS